MKTVYLLPSRGYSSDRLVRLATSLPVEKWCYLGSDASVRLTLDRALSSRVEWVSIAEELDAVTQRLREPFLEVMGRLAVLNSSPLWWSTELASKNPYGARVFLDACLMQVGKRLLQDGSGRVLLVVDSPAVLKELKHVARVRRVSVQDYTPGWHPARLMVSRAARSLYRRAAFLKGFLRQRREFRRRGWPPAQPFKGRDTALLFTWVDRRNFTPSGAYSDPHLGCLSDHLQTRGYRVAYVPRVLGTTSFGEVLERLRQTGELFLFPEALLTLGDVLSAVFRTLWYRPALLEDLAVDGVDITPLIAEQIGEERQGINQVTAYLYYSFMRRLACAAVNPQFIFYTFEGHSWGHVMCVGAREHMPEVRVVAFENLVCARMLLSAYPSCSGLSVFPLPDRVITSGPLFSEAFVEAGYPAERVVSAAAIRHAYLWQRAAVAHRPTPRRPICVCVATAIGFSDSIELIDKAIRAFGGLPEWKVLIKCHPAVEVSRIRAMLGAQARASNVHFVDTPVSELLLQAHLLLYTYTSVCFEALMHGVPPVFVRAENWLNIDLLEQAPEIRWSATGPDEIREAALKAVDMSEDEWLAWYRRAREVVEQSLAPVTPERLDRFLC